MVEDEALQTKGNQAKKSAYRYLSEKDEGKHLMDNFKKLLYPAAEWSTGRGLDWVNFAYW
jgi:hypothetical protein